ncbi:hypothetical protein BOTBODRAFT_39854 [Botryobasidium botryosum FD-172 SS1]|uniref:Uncharacterized protein n=1 Tax=Botryobasidium botryosum (strain FD-172 SS1) TaxID=930990 RepID=A0A067LSI3_BOTB1|nr:hypothetical protein BOTBODRAFT_39854 [Botryobasidium botryosum FD-172 SS1]
MMSRSNNSATSKPFMKVFMTLLLTSNALARGFAFVSRHEPAPLLPEHPSGNLPSFSFVGGKVEYITPSTTSGRTRSRIMRDLGGDELASPDLRHVFQSGTSDSESI